MVFCSVSLTNVSALVPVPCCSCYYGSVVYLEIRYNDRSCIALFPQNCKFRYDFKDSPDLKIKFLLFLFISCSSAQVFLTFVLNKTQIRKRWILNSHPNYHTHSTLACIVPTLEEGLFTSVYTCE